MSMALIGGGYVATRAATGLSDFLAEETTAPPAVRQAPRRMPSQPNGARRSIAPVMGRQRRPGQPGTVTKLGRAFNGKRFVYVTHEQRPASQSNVIQRGPSDEGEESNNLALSYTGVPFDVLDYTGSSPFKDPTPGAGGFVNFTPPYLGSGQFTGGGMDVVQANNVGHSTRDTVAGLINNGLGLLGNILGRNQTPTGGPLVVNPTPPVGGGAATVAAATGGVFDTIAASLGVSTSTLLLLGGGFVFAVFFMGPSRRGR